MKAKLSLLLALVFAFSLLFASCGENQKSPAEAEKPAEQGEAPAAEPAEEPADQEAEPGAAADTELAGEISVQAEEAWVPYYEAAIQRLKEKYPQAEVKLITVGSFDHLETIDSTDVTNKDVADVFAFPLDRFTNLFEKDALAPIAAPEMAERLGGFPSFDQPVAGAMAEEGQYFSFPFNIETLVVYANEANAKAEGIDLSKPLELTTVEKAETALLPIFDAWFGVALTNSAQIELLGKSSDNQLFSDFAKPWAELSPEHQAFVEGIYKYWQLNNEANTPLFDPEAGWGYIDEQFKSGKAGVVRLGGPWEINAVKELTNGGKDLGIYPISQITLNGQPLAHWQGGWSLGVNARLETEPEKLALAQALIEEIVNPAHAVELFQATGKILGNVPAENYQNSDLDEIDKLTIAATIESYQKSVNRPLFREWGEVWDTYKNAILSWNSVKPTSPEEAYAQLEASFNALLAQH